MTDFFETPFEFGKLYRAVEEWEPGQVRLSNIERSRGFEEITKEFVRLPNNGVTPGDVLMLLKLFLHQERSFARARHVPGALFFNVTQRSFFILEDTTRMPIVENFFVLITFTAL